MWHYDHSVHVTGNHVYRGLVGRCLVQDAVEQKSSLPKEWGVGDIPLVLKHVMIGLRR